MTADGHTQADALSATLRQHRSEAAAAVIGRVSLDTSRPEVETQMLAATATVRSKALASGSTPPPLPPQGACVPVASMRIVCDRDGAARSNASYWLCWPCQIERSEEHSWPARWSRRTRLPIRLPPVRVRRTRIYSSPRPPSCSRYAHGKSGQQPSSVRCWNCVPDDEMAVQALNVHEKEEYAGWQSGAALPGAAEDAAPSLDELRRRREELRQDLTAAWTSRM